MRSWGRVFGYDGTYEWIEVTTDPNGYNDAVWITTLIQCLLLVLGESPFYANYGIPAIQSVMTQIFPDYYVQQTQQQFAQYFSSLVITRIPAASPTYNISLITTQGFPFQVTIAGNDSGPPGPNLFTLDYSTLGGGNVLG